MLNPIIISPPAALAFIAMFAAALYTINRFLGSEPVSPWTGQPWATPTPTGGRHRPENIPAAERRDWASITAGRLNAPQAWPVDHGTAGHDDHGIDWTTTWSWDEAHREARCRASADETTDELATVA